MNTFKHLIWLVSALISFNALADGTQKYSRMPPAIQLIAKEVERCSYQPTVMTRYGRKRYGNMQSRCQTLVIDGRLAHLKLGRDVFTLELRDSPMSDGDFGDLSILDSRSKVIFQARGLLAYGDVVYALVGELEAQNQDPATDKILTAPIQQRSGGRF